jgi:hypothetical protein
MPFGQKDTQDLTTIRRLVEGFADRYTRNEMARIQNQRERADREAESRVIETFAQAIRPRTTKVRAAGPTMPGGEEPSAFLTTQPRPEDVYAGVVGATAAGRGGGPRTQQAIANAEKQAGLWKQFRGDTSTSPFELWRQQNPDAPVEKYFSMQTEQAVTRNRESKPEIVGWENRMVNGVNMLMPITGFVGDDGSVRRVDPKAFHPQLSSSAPGGGGSEREKNLEKLRQEYLNRNELVGQTEDYYGKEDLTKWREELKADVDYTSLLNTPEGTAQLALQGMDKTKAHKINALLQYEKNLAKKESTGRSLNGLGFAVDADTGELRKANPKQIKATNPSRPKEAKGPLSNEDREAVAWAKANRSDPRAKKILDMHGVK